MSSAPAPRDAAVLRYLEHVTEARRLAPRSVVMIRDGLGRLEARCVEAGLALQATATASRGGADAH